MPGVHRQRRQDGEDLLLEHAEDPRPLGGIEVLDAREVKAGPGETGNDRRLEHLVAALHEADALDADVRELLRGAAPVRRPRPKPGRDMVLEAPDAHLEELVEPRGQDGHELHALEERERGVRRKIDEAIGEVEPRKLTVEEAVRARQRATRRYDSGFHDPDATVKSCSPSP